MKLEFRTHAQHLSFEKFGKCNLCNSYRKLFKQIHEYINCIFLIKISENKKSFWIAIFVLVILKTNIFLGLIEHELNSLVSASHLEDHMPYAMVTDLRGQVGSKE